MKAGIHPQYFPEATITCANCSKKFTTGATKEDIRIEICSNCHPFFTGKNVLIDTEGRVDRFRKKQEGATGRTKKERKKKTLEEKVNEEIAAQLQKENLEEAKKEEKKKAAKAEKKPEAAVGEMSEEKAE